jgi:hypothetical protein
MQQIEIINDCLIINLKYFNVMIIIINLCKDREAHPCRKSLGSLLLQHSKIDGKNNAEYGYAG